MRAGAGGYVLKDATKDELRRAIQAVGNGEAIFSPSVAARVMAYFAQPPSRSRPLRHLRRPPENTTSSNCPTGWSNIRIADHFAVEWQDGSATTAQHPSGQ